MNTSVDLCVRAIDAIGAPTWRYVSYPVRIRILAADSPPDDVRDGRAEWATHVPPDDSTVDMQLLLQGDGARYTPCTLPRTTRHMANDVAIRDGT